MDTSRPELPAGRAVELPGRGVTWAYDSGSSSEARRPVVLLLHGWTSTAALNWFSSMPLLSLEHRVLALDHRGHGRGIRSHVPFRLEDCADDAAALARKLGIERLIAVGYSMGGPVAKLLWRRHPDLVTGLVLCATAARFATRPELSGSLGTLGLSGAAMALSLLPGNLRRQGMSLATRNLIASGGVSPWAVEEWERHDPAALIQAGLALGRFDSTAWLPDIDVPTAVVVTANDSVVSPRRQWYLAQSIPGALAFPVDGDHRACVERPREFVPALLAACRSVRSVREGGSAPAAAGPPDG